MLHKDVQNNLPDYGEIAFDLCVAVEAPAPDAVSLLSGGVGQRLRGARLLRMFDVLSQPMRTVYLSMPNKLDDLSLRVRYGGFR